MLLEDISDDIDFCFKLVREELVIFFFGKDIILVFLIMNIILSVIFFLIYYGCGWVGIVVGFKNWLRIMFVVDVFLIEEVFKRIKCFYFRYVKI